MNDCVESRRVLVHVLSAIYTLRKSATSEVMSGILSKTERDEGHQCKFPAEFDIEKICSRGITHH